MDIGCNCFGVAAAAKVPVKRYNFLVPAIYPTIEPSYEKPFTLNTEKALKKLVEYLERNEHRVPKVRLFFCRILAGLTYCRCYRHSPNDNILISICYITGISTSSS